MSIDQQIALLQKAYRLVNNKTSLSNLEIAQVRDYVNMVLDDLIDKRYEKTRQQESS